MTCEKESSSPFTRWSHGITSRPSLSWMPTPGPVAYHVQFSGLTAALMFSGFDHVAPSSSLKHISTSREPGPDADLFFATELAPALRVSGSQRRLVVRSRTGHGLPTVSAPSSTTT